MADSFPIDIVSSQQISEPLIIRSKLMPPRQRMGVVARPRVVSRIERGSDRKLITVVGTAGSGKSTSVAQWAESTNRKVAWISISDAENRPPTFLASLFWSAARVLPVLADDEQRLLDVWLNYGTRAVITGALNALAAVGEPVTLVIDDYHQVTSDDIHQIMALMLADLPNNVGFILIGRSDPPIQLARLRAQGELLELGQEDLRFSSEEAIEFFHLQDDLNLPVDDIVRLHESVEGWVTGLQLAAVTQRLWPDRTIDHFVTEATSGTGLVADFVVEEILGGLPAELQTFMEQISVLDHFTIPLCRALTGREDCEEFISDIERRNLFLIRLDDRGEWYRFHQLVAEAVRTRFVSRSSAADVQRVHRNAGLWFEQAQLPNDAFGHFVGARDWPRATGFLQDTVYGAIAQNHLSTAIRQASRVPVTELRSKPEVLFWYCFALTRLGHFKALTAPLGILESITAENDKLGRQRLRILKALRGIMTSDFAMARTVLEQIDDQLFLDNAVLAAYIPGMRGAIGVLSGDAKSGLSQLAVCRARLERNHVPMVFGEEISVRALGLALQGRLTEVVELLTGPLGLIENMGPQQWSLSTVTLTRIYLERGDAERALELARRNVQTCEEEALDAIMPDAQNMLGQVLYLLGEYEAGSIHLQRAKEFGLAHGQPEAVRFAEARMAWIAINMGELGISRQWRMRMRDQPIAQSIGVQQAEDTTNIRLLIAEEDFDTASARVAQMRRRAEAEGRMWDAISCQTMDAVIKLLTNQEDEAHAIFSEALAMGEAEGFQQSYTLYGEASQRLLRRAAQRSRWSDYAARILQGTGVRGTFGSVVRSAMPSPEEQLSMREVDILALVAAGRSNRDIAEALFISEWTVKKHLSNIMRKLTVANRVQAVAEARRLGVV